MADLIAPETSTCKCLRCLCHSDSNLYVTLGDHCIILHSLIWLTTVALFTWKGCGFSFTPDPSSGAGGTIQTAGMVGSIDFLLMKQKCMVAFGFEVKSLVFLASVKVDLCFLLHSKFDEVIVGRPLTCGLPINHMGQLRVHALKEVIN